MSRFDFADIKPDAASPMPSTREIDAVGERQGFESREPTQRIYKKEQQKEATVPLSIRPPVSVANRFVLFCKENRLTYPQGLEELMKRAGI